MSLQRFALGLCLLTALGCSGLSSLVVQNKADQAVTVRVRSMPSREHKVFEEDVSHQIQAGSEEEMIKWFSAPPAYVKVEAQVGGRVLTGAWDSTTYPPGMAKGTSGGAFYILEVDSSALKLRDPNAWDRFRRNPQYVLLPLGCLGMLGSAIAFAIWLTRRITGRRVQTQGRRTD